MSATPVDLAHHLSQEARLRKPNSMKEIWRLARRKPNMISLANGDPHSSLYPIQSLTFNVASVAEKDPVATWRAGGSSAPTHTLTSSRDEASVLPVRTAFQYTTGAGLIETQQAVTELTRFYHNPPDHAATLTLGNGDGVTKCFRLLGSPGDHFLADEFTFSSLANAAVPHGIKWVSVKIDEGGLIPEELENILVNWSEERGPRPHVLYTVPCGQNPTGSTLSVERRKKIYELARRFDLLIIEDDPYYFLQYTSEPSSPEAEAAPVGSEGAVSSRGLAPSFLSLDTDGRVLRVDSFSKVFAPGMRLGVITSSPFFHAHLVALTDSSTQHPHAFGQLFLAELLGPAGWTLAGFDAWVRSLRDEYRRRRDVFLGFFETEVAPLGLVDASVPEAGMFVWTKINVERHPRFRREAGEAKAQGARTNCRQLMEELFELCLDNGLVVMPAWVFALPTDPKYDDPENPVEDRMNYFRLTFAGTEEAMEDGLKIFGQSLKEFFVEKPKPVEN